MEDGGKNVNDLKNHENMQEPWEEEQQQVVMLQVHLVAIKSSSANSY
jgi:hypothetical protein